MSNLNDEKQGMSYGIAELVSNEKKVAKTAVDTIASSSIEGLDEQSNAGALQNISVQFDDEITPVDIPEIKDEHGRLSDILEALEDELGISVIPLKMANIAPEVTMLQRHEIFTFGGERYAFSKRVRHNVCDRYTENIVASISEGLPFQMELVTGITWNDKEYRTLLLSRTEWTLILSKFRQFKQSLMTDDKTQFVLKVCAERV